jgi:RNA polymerase sigma-B factor
MATGTMSPTSPPITSASTKSTSTRSDGTTNASRGGGHRHARSTRAQARLTAACDRARACMTVPRVPASRRWVAAFPVRPMIDMDLWTRHVAYARRRDHAVLGSLVDEYRGFAIASAKRYYRHGELLEDLVQVALESLVQALERFDPDRRTPFLGFARPTVIGSLRRHYRDVGWSVRVPRRVHELATPLRDATDWLSQDLGREPTVAELADFLDVSEHEVRATQQASDARCTTPLDPADSGSPVDSNPALATTDRNLVAAENRMALAECMERLSNDDRALLHRYYVERRTQSDIAAELGCSQMQVSRLLSRVIEQMRVDFFAGA